MADKQLGSASVGMEIDLSELQAQLNKASRMIGDVENKANKSSPKKGGGLFGSILSGSDEALSALGSVGRGGGGISGVTSALGGLRGAFAGVAAAGAGGAAAMTGVGLAIGAVLLVVAGAVLAFKGLQAAVQGAFAALQSAGNLQATETTFQVLAQNMGVGADVIDQYREALEKMNYVGAEQTQIMSGLLRSNVGLNDTTLQAVGAMRDLSVAAGVASTEGINTMNQAITTLNPQLLQNYGLTETATQVFDNYGATIGKTSTEMTNAEKRQAILNAVVAKGAQTAGAADAAQGDLNRTVTQLRANFETLKAGIGQVFLPLASGIVSMINSEIFGLSKSVDENRGKFESMGQTIASKVLPMVQGLITWIKNIPWVGIISGIARVLAGFGLFAKTVSLVGQVVSAVFRVAGLTIASVGVVIERTIALFATLGQVAGAAWDALTGKSSLNDFVSNVNSAFSSFGQETSNMLSGLYGEWDDTFSDITSGVIETIDGMVNDANTLVNGFNIKEYWEGLPNSVANGFGGAQKEAANGAEGMSAAGLKALKQMQDDMAKENADFARRQADALRDYQESLAEAVAQHRDNISRIRKDISKEQKAYEKAYGERTREYQDELNKLNKADESRKKDIQTQIAEELAKGRFADQARLASLRSRLSYEDSAHKEAVQQAEESYQADIDNSKASYEERMATLQESLDAELEIQKRHQTDFNTYRDYQAKDDITKLKEQYARRKAEDERAHAERLADIVRQGAESAASANQQGLNEGAAMMNGLSGGIRGSIPKIKDSANAAGKEAGQSTADGVDSKKTTVKDKVIGILKNAAAGAAVGSIFGPVGTLVGAVIGGGIGASGGSVGSALRDMLESAKHHLGNLWSWGRDIVAKMGKGIADAFGKAGGAFKSAWNSVGLPAFANGGIVGGRHGIDNNIAQVSRGEMILNRDQQQRMFNMLDGRVEPGSGSNGGGIMINELNLSLPSVRNASDFERELKLKFATMRTI